MSTPPPAQPHASTSAPNSGKSTSISRDAPIGTNAVHDTSLTRNPDMPAFEIERDNARNAGDDDWEDEIVIERSPRGRTPPHSILHRRQPGGSRDHSAESAPPDLANSPTHHARTVSFWDYDDRNGGDGGGSSHHTNRSIKDYVNRRLNLDHPIFPTASEMAASLTQSLNPASSHPHPHFIAPDDTLLEEGSEEIGVPRPESPEKYAFGFPYPRESVNSAPVPGAVSAGNAPLSAATDANPLPAISSNVIPPPGFQIESIPPTISNPLSPIATPTPDPNPARSKGTDPLRPQQGGLGNNNLTMSQNPLDTRAANPSSRSPPQFLTADANLTTDNAKRRAQYSTEVRRERQAGQAGTSRQGELDRRRPQRESEIGPIRHHHGSRRKGGRRRAEPYRPLDPYAFPMGMRRSPIPPFLGAVRWAVEWAEDKFGLGEESDEEGERSSKGSKASVDSKGKGKEKPNGDSIPMTETGVLRGNDGLPAGLPDNIIRRHAAVEAIRSAEEAEKLEWEKTRAVLRRESRELNQEFQEREKALEEAERLELEHGFPTVPRTSPTAPKRPIDTSDGTESAPAGRLPIPGLGSSTPGMLSPPKASPDNRPASDPGSPLKRHSPFFGNFPLSLRSMPKFPPPVIEAEKQVELTLRQWVGFAAVQVYRHIMLRLPSLYFNRVGRVFLEADISAKEVQMLINQGTVAGPNSDEAKIMDGRSPYKGFGGRDIVDNDESQPLLGGHHESNSPSPNNPYQVIGELGDYHTDMEAGSMFRGTSIAEGGTARSQIDPSLAESLKRVERFRLEWESFVDGLIKEWKTLNVVSALLLTALLTFFQIQDAAYVPVTRTAALLSLVSAFLSLLFGGTYIIRFSTMRTMRKAARWVEETRKENQRIFWNIWVLLSMPFTWLAYSLIFFCIAVMGFVWTSGTGENAGPPNPPIPNKAAVILGPRIAITIIFSLGTIYFCLVLNTFRSWSGATISPTETTGDFGRRSGETDRISPYQTPAGGNTTALPPMGGLGAGVIGVTTSAVPVERDGLSALAPANMQNETRQQRVADITKGLENRSTGSVGSALRLELTPPIHSRNIERPQLTETPPSMAPLLPGLEAPITTVTQPTPVTAEARPFHSREQSVDLDQPLPTPNAPLPAIQEVTEFGSFSRAGGGAASRELRQGEQGRLENAGRGIPRAVGSQESAMPESAWLEEGRGGDGGEKDGFLGRLGRLVK